MNDRVSSGASLVAHRSSLSLPGERSLPLGRQTLVMGIINVTPDSFSDGGVHLNRGAAVDAAMRMIDDGAAIIDIGGESTRPGAAPVSIDEERRRVIPVLDDIRKRCDAALSIDTRHAAVAEAALDAGADIVNDVSALRHDPAMGAAVARRGVPVILMHMRGTPETMQKLAVYDDVVAAVIRELSQFRAQAIAAGIQAGSILVDPGIGFAKTWDQNLELLARCDELAAIAPVVVGASRKAFIGHLTGSEAGSDRMPGSLAAVAAAVRGGAAIVRVHDVRATVDFLKVLSAIEAKRPTPRPETTR
jgi:dihydropteroate synthase